MIYFNWYANCFYNFLLVCFCILSFFGKCYLNKRYYYYCCHYVWQMTPQCWFDCDLIQHMVRHQFLNNGVTARSSWHYTKKINQVRGQCLLSITTTLSWLRSPHYLNQSIAPLVKVQTWTQQVYIRLGGKHTFMEGSYFRCELVGGRQEIHRFLSTVKKTQMVCYRIHFLGAPQQ